MKSMEIQIINVQDFRQYGLDGFEIKAIIDGVNYHGPLFKDKEINNE